MSVNKDEPRIQANIAVRVGGKNDPAETNSSRPLFEHLMFKGTERFGTTDYAAEKPLLDQIENLFEVYRKTKDEDKRKEIYHQIDSISYQASLLAIPNEYDKLMSAISATGTNAYTSYDVTCYTENIPSNEIENWAMIQADRFEHPVIRGFHTELETIYEEKNMSLTSDGRKMNEAMLTALFPSHPYGTQTVLGTQENLKDPSTSPTSRTTTNSGMCPTTWPSASPVTSIPTTWSTSSPNISDTSSPTTTCRSSTSPPKPKSSSRSTSKSSVRKPNAFTWHGASRCQRPRHARRPAHASGAKQRQMRSH